MKKNSVKTGIFDKPLMAAFLFLFLLAFPLTRPAQAQLVISNKLLKVVKVDMERGRIEITRRDNRPDAAMGYVYVDGRTSVFRDGKPFPLKGLKKGWIIRVRGGVRLDMNVNAFEITVVDAMAELTN